MATKVPGVQVQENGVQVQALGGGSCQVWGIAPLTSHLPAGREVVIDRGGGWDVSMLRDHLWCYVLQSLLACSAPSGNQGTLPLYQEAWAPSVSASDPQNISVILRNREAEHGPV